MDSGAIYHGPMNSRVMVFVAVVAATVSGSGCLQAQRVNDSRMAVVSTGASRGGLARQVSLTPKIGTPRNANFGKRLVAGTIGMIGGAWAGYAYGESQGEGCRNACYFGSDAEIAGFLIGWVGGAALGAALPSFGSSCSLGTRTLRGLGGSAVGLVGGGIVAFVPVAGIVGIIGAPFGAAFAQQECS